MPETAPEVKREAPPSTSTEASSYGQVKGSSAESRILFVQSNVNIIKRTGSETCSNYTSSQIFIDWMLPAKTTVN